LPSTETSSSTSPTTYVWALACLANHMYTRTAYDAYFSVGRRASSPSVGTSLRLPYLTHDIVSRDYCCAAPRVVMAARHCIQIHAERGLHAVD
jgi:hypothetical protein